MLNRTRDDEGVAIVIAVMTVAVCLSLALIGIQVSLSSTRASGVDRQRVLAISAAEAGVDAAYAAIQNGGANPPCTLSSATVRSGPDVASYATTVAYYAPGGAPLACDAAGLVIGKPAQALIKTAAKTNVLGGGGSKGARTMEALVNLIPVQVLNKAIFADGTLNFTNKTTVTGNEGADADIYSNKSVSCANNENFAGSVYSQGDITISNTCTFAANVWAGGKVVTSGGSNGAIAGFVKAGSGVVNLSGVNVSGNLYAGSTITYAGCSAAGKCYPNSSPGSPPLTVFPTIRGDAASIAEWTAAAPNGPGYTSVIDSGSCTNFANRLKTDYSQRTVPTLVQTACKVSLSNEKTIALKTDLAIFAQGGFEASQQNEFASSAPGTARKLHWIVPFTASITRECATPSIVTEQLFSITDDVDMFLYSPCNIEFANSSTHVGQIYGGSTVTIKNQFNMQFRPVPVFGVDLTLLPALSYTPSIIYKRETR